MRFRVIKKEGLWTFFMFLRRDWWECGNFSNHSGQGQNHISEKDAKSIPTPRKFRKAKLKNIHGLLQKGAKEPCILLTPTMCLCFGSKQAQTHPGLPDQCKRAGRSVQTGAGSNPHQNKSQIHLSHKTAWNPELHIKQKGKSHVIFWFSNFTHAFHFEHSCSLFSGIRAISDVKILPKTNKKEDRTKRILQEGTIHYHHSCRSLALFLPALLRENGLQKWLKP